MKCENCPCSNSPYVEGIGNTQYCKLLVVGTAPGKTEEVTEEAFTGKAGLLVREVLQYLKIDGNAFYTNVLKRRSENKKPTKEEKFRCGNHLMCELMELEPFIVLTLGQVPFDFMVPTFSQPVTQVHGLPLPVQRFSHHFIVVSTYSPSYVLRRGGLESEVGSQFIDDCIDVREKMKEIDG